MLYKYIIKLKLREGLFMLTKRTNVMLVAICVILALFVGCAGKSSQSTETPTDTSSSQSTGTPTKEDEQISLRFSWWGGDTRHEATLEAMELFTKQNPNIKISGEYGGFDGYFTKLTTQLSSQTAPDIVQVDQPVMGDLTSRGDFFVDFEEYGDIIDISGFEKSFLESYSYYKNKLLGLPTGINAPNILINTAVADAVGIDLSVPYTWDKLFEDAKKVREYDPEMYLLNIGKNPIRYHILIPYMYQLIGTHPIQDDFTLGLTRDELIEAYTLIRRIYAEGVTEPAAQSKPFETFYETNPKWINHQYVAMCHEASMTGPEFYNFPDTATVVLTPMREDAKDTGIVVKHTVKR
jgi:oligogalacturonide transport system substrate-binding protein